MYKDNRISRAEFIYMLEQKLLRAENDNVSLEEIAMMINNIRIYLIQSDREYYTNQYFIRWKYLFRGYEIIAWIETNFSSTRFT